MADDGQVEAWSAKDLIVGVPLLASALALSWQVGRITPYGGFLLFSASDHIVSAVRALPVAIYVSVWLAGTFLALNRQKSFIEGHPYLAVASAIGTTLGAFVASWWLDLPLGISATFLAAVYVILLNLANRWFSWRGTTGLMLAAMISVSGAYIFAYSFSQAEMRIIRNEGNPDNNIVVEFKDGRTWRGFPVMSGEHGLLIFDPLAEMLSFGRTDDIKAITWTPNYKKPSKI